MERAKPCNKLMHLATVACIISSWSCIQSFDHVQPLLKEIEGELTLPELSFPTHSPWLIGRFNHPNSNSPRGPSNQSPLIVNYRNYSTVNKVPPNYIYI